MPGLKKRWNEMTQLLGMEEVNLKKEFKRDMPDLAKLFGYVKEGTVVVIY